MASSNPILISFQADALLVQSGLAKITHTLEGSLRRLTSGERTAESSDQPRDKMESIVLRAQLIGQSSLLENLQTGVSMMEIALSALDEMIGNASEARKILDTRLYGDNLTREEHKTLYTQFGLLLNQNYNIMDSTAFNDIPLLNNGFNATVAQDSESGYSYTISFSDLSVVANYPLDNTVPDTDMNSNTLDDETIADFQANATAVDATFDTRISNLETERGNVIAAMSQFQSAIESITSKQIELSRAESYLSTTDLAKEGAIFARASVFQDSALVALGESQDLTQIVLKALDHQVYGS